MVFKIRDFAGRKKKKATYDGSCTSKSVTCTVLKKWVGFSNYLNKAFSKWYSVR